jgi:predicted permease
VSTLLSDVRLAWRSLLCRPLFTAGVLLTLALGIGANTAIFSVIDGVLLRPLPYRDADRLVLIWSKWNNFEKTWLSDWEYFQYQAQGRLFQDVAAWETDGSVSLTGDQGPESVPSARITHNLLDVLGVSPARGRALSAEEDVPNGPRVALLGYDLWQRRFGGDPGLVGRTILVDGEPWTVVGVLPRSFRFPLEFQSLATAQLVTPIRLDPSNTNAGNHGYYGVGRLQPGITPGQVTTQLRGLTRRWTAEGRYPESMQFSAFSVPVKEEVSGGARTALLVLLGAVSLLLLITCANVANLLLTRADGRGREMAVRAALGAGHRRLLRLALTESMVLALMGGLLGLILAWGGVRALTALAPTSLPRTADVGMNGVVLGFTVALSVVTGFLFGTMPALRVARINLVAALNEGGRGGEGRQARRGRAFLVTTEMAIAVMLLIGATLLIRSFGNLNRLDPGFDPHGLLTLRLSLPPVDYPGDSDVVRFYQDVGEEVRRLPGVEQAGFVRVLPLADEIGDAGMAIEGKPVTPGEPRRSADWQVVTPGYFEAMRIPLVRGRFFDRTDTPEGLQVIAINQTLATQYFGAEDPIGQHIRVGGEQRPWRTIVAVVGDTRHNGLTNPVKRAWFIPHNQFANSWGSARRAMTLVVRSGGDPRAMLAPLERVIHRRDSNLPLSAVATMDDVMNTAVQAQRFTTTLMAGFAALALVLAAVGIYAVISYSVSQRTREIGIRLALGADGGSVRELVIRQGMTPALAGIALGIAGAFVLSRVLSGLLYGVTVRDPATFLLIPVALAMVALASTVLPAGRATRVHPMEALRYE